MPDTGYNAYLSVSPDNTVVVPNNIDVGGVITQGDLVTHPELQDVVDYIDASVTVEALTDSGMAPEIDVVGDEVIRGGPARITPGGGQYSFDIDQPTGSLAQFFVDYDFSPDGPPGVWPEWLVAGQLVITNGSFAFESAVDQGAGVVRFYFVSLSGGLQTCQGTFVFYVIGNPPA